MWKLKVLFQFVLARVPGGERANYLLQQFKGSHRPATIRHHMLHVFTELRSVHARHPIEGCAVVEIGTGWDTVGAFCLYMFGAASVTTYDHVRHVRLRLARTVVGEMRAALDEIATITGVPRAQLEERLARLEGASAPTLEALLKAANITYVAPGDAATTGLPPSSVDLVYSHAVLEHVPERVVHELAVEARRILRPGGMAFHFIGYGDHYSGTRNRGVSGVNFLQYSPERWAFWVYNRIAYHNRLREKQFMDIFASHGASVEAVSHHIRPRDLVALDTLVVHPAFGGMTHEELAVHNGLVGFSFADALALSLQSSRGAGMPDRKPSIDRPHGT